MGTMVFEANTILDDQGGAVWWQRTCDNGYFEFNRDADLDGDFVSGDDVAEQQGTWDFEGLIRTCGDLTVLHCDMIGIVGGSGGFEYAAFNGTCNPGSSGGTIACTNWEVSLENVFCNID
jgi:hypothetical protein